VKDRTARYMPDRCTDCGICLTVCPWGAIGATTWQFEDLGRFKFKVAVPSPVLFGQFPAGVTPSTVARGLLMLGFDAVWDYAPDVELVARAIRAYVEAWKGAAPLISISCPVVVRLVQVQYPRMVDQLIPVQVPREIAGRAIKKRYSEELGIPKEDIGAFYITPCQARTISVLQPAEGATSHLDGTLGIADVYNGILAYAAAQKEDPRKGEETIIRNSTILAHAGDRMERFIPTHRYLRVTGLANIIQLFGDIEKGKLRNVDFLEAYSCWNGCMAGNLTVNNVYVTRSRFHSLIRGLPAMDPVTEAEVTRRSPDEDFTLDQPIRARPIKGRTGTLKERVQMVQLMETTLASLPGLNCGLCGTPTCKELARDVSTGDATKQDCVFFSRDRLRDLRRAYLRRPE
jgi:ferredoxin